jgi:hypothetical protein
VLGFKDDKASRIFSTLNIAESQKILQTTRGWITGLHPLSTVNTPQKYLLNKSACSNELFVSPLLFVRTFSGCTVRRLPLMIFISKNFKSLSTVVRPTKTHIKQQKSFWQPTARGHNYSFVIDLRNSLMALHANSCLNCQCLWNHQGNSILQHG